jgi:hypothetical protein
MKTFTFVALVLEWKLVVPQVSTKWRHSGVGAWGAGWGKMSSPRGRGGELAALGTSVLPNQSWVTSILPINYKWTEIKTIRRLDLV